MGYAAHTAKAPFGAELLRACAAPFVFVGELLVALAEAGPRMQQVKELNSKTDEDLAEQGLTRAGEVNRIFGDRLYL